jgi:hypothetical protein
LLRRVGQLSAVRVGEALVAALLRAGVAQPASGVEVRCQGAPLVRHAGPKLGHLIVKIALVLVN